MKRLMGAMKTLSAVLLGTLGVLYIAFPARPSDFFAGIAMMAAGFQIFFGGHQ